MPIRVACPQCRASLSAPDGAAGKTGKCKKCGASVRVPSLTLCNVSEPRHRVESSAPAEPPSDAALPPTPEAAKIDNYFEVLDQSGETIRYSTLNDVRNALLSGRITRHNKARQVCPEPTMADFKHIEDKVNRTLEYREADNRWRRRSSWRRIGKGLARDENAIKMLYQPLAACAHNGGMIACVICFVIAFLGCIVLAIFLMCNSGEEKVSAQERQRPFTPGAAGAGALLTAVPFVRQVAGIITMVTMAFLGGGVMAFAVGYPMGSAIGAVVYLVRKDSFPRPPDDGYDNITS